MFKRANKITALLVSAASVISVIPAMATDSISRLGVKEGTIESAVAYKDGKYVYEGYKSDSDEEGIYYNTGDKDRLLEDIKDAIINDVDNKGIYGSEYVFVVDGNDQYLVDFTNGEIVNDETPEDIADTAAVNLKKALKKTDRYGKSITVTSSNLGYDDSDTDAVKTGAISGTKFGNDIWYTYSITPVSNIDDTVNNLLGSKLYGFTNQSGNYIDACNIANIYAYSTLKGKTVKIDEFSNNANDVDSETGLLATLKSMQVLTQDKDYIYSRITVNITDNAYNLTIGEKTPTVTATTTAAAIVGAKTTKHVYIQKISKEQGEQKDGAYIPKSVDSYELLDDNNKLDADKSKKATKAINAADKSGGKIKYSVVNGQLLCINNDGTEVTVGCISLKKAKVKYDVDAAVVGLNSINDKVDIYLAEKGGIGSGNGNKGSGKSDNSSVDIENLAAVDVDVDGNVWAIGNGKIYKFKNNNFTPVYTTDRSLDSLSVYDEGSLFAWEDDGNAYTTVNEGKAEIATEYTAVAPIAVTKIGWNQLADGTWNYYDATGAKLVSKWINTGGAWYYLKADGAMSKGWLNNNGMWYYLNESGVMLSNTTVDGYVLGSSGAMIG